MFVRLREVSALEHVHFMEVPLYLQSRVNTQYRNIMYITPSNIKHFIERSSGKKWVPSGF